MASSKTSPDVITLTEAELELLVGRLETSNLNDTDKKIVIGLLRAALWLRQKYASGKIGFYKLATLLFGKSTEKRPRSPKTPDPGSPTCKSPEQDKEEAPCDKPEETLASSSPCESSCKASYGRKF